MAALCRKTKLPVKEARNNTGRLVHSKGKEEKMNIATSHPGSFGKHFKGRYIAAAGTLAIAASALIAAAPWHDAGHATPAPVSQTARTNRTLETGPSVLYLVGSQAEAT